MDQLTMEDAIARVSGNYAYQKRTLLILSLSQFALSFIIMGLPFMLPPGELDCDSEGVCKVPEKFLNTATADFHLFGTKKYLIGLVGTSYFIGMMIGALFISWISDTYGRQKTIKLFTLLGVPVMLLIAFSWNIWVIVVSYFFVGMLEIGIYVPGFIMLTEYVKSAHRNLFSGIFFSCWGIFAIFLSMLYMLGVPWRITFILASISLLSQFFFVNYIYESPRFLLVNHKNIEETLKVLNSISIINGTGTFHSTIKHEIIEENVSHSYLSFFQNKYLFKKFSICSILWFNIVLAYYGMVFIMPSLFPNVYIEGAVMALAETIASFLATYFVNKIGRKKSAIVCFIIGGISFTVIWMLPKFLSENSANKGILVFSAIGRFFVGAEFFLIYIYTAELFPTRVRNMAFGICNVVGRVAGMISSNLLTICLVIGVNPAAIMAVSLIFSSILSTFLEETLGKNMLEFIEKNSENPSDEAVGDDQVVYKQID